MEIIISIDDQASEALRNLATVLDNTTGKMDNMGKSMQRTNIHNMAALEGIRGLEHGFTSLSTGAEHFFGKDNQVVKGLKDLEAGLRMVMAPMYAYKGILALTHMENLKVALSNQSVQLSLIGVALAAGAVAATYGAMTAATEDQRAQYASLAAAMWGMTAATWAYTAARTSAWIAETLGAAGPVIIAAIAGVVATVGSYAALRYMAEGGIVTRTTPVVLGDAGPEVVFPLDKLGKFMNAGGRGGNTYYINAGNASSQEVRNLRRMLDKHDKDERFRRGELAIRV